MKHFILCVLLALLASACRPTVFASSRDPARSGIPSPGQPVVIIPMTIPLVNKGPELSGLAWYGDTLILMPQYPERFKGGSQGALLTLSRADILAYLDGKKTAPLTVGLLPFYASGLEHFGWGYEGFESIAVEGEQVYMTIESHVGLWQYMMAYLVSGRIAPDLSRLEVDASHLASIRPQTRLFNLSDEAMLVVSDQVLTLDEANGVTANPAPRVHRFNRDLSLSSPLPFLNVEYRLTDATPPDVGGRFWAVNVYNPRDNYFWYKEDGLVERFGNDYAHSRMQPVERLVEFQVQPDAVGLSGRPPIRLQTLPRADARDWEGLARLDGRGFLLVNDAHRNTLLGFVAQSGN